MPVKTDIKPALVPMPPVRQTPFGPLRAKPFTGDAELPTEADVVIIGGGIIGVMSAYFLAKRNIKVVLCEKAEIACESSSRAFGWVSELLLDPAKMPLSAESKRLWAEVHADAGETGFRQSGLVYFAENAGELDYYAGWLESVKGLGSADNTILNAAGMRSRYPGAARDWVGGIFAPSDGGAEPRLAATTVAEAAQRAGATVVTGCTVRTLDIAGGRINGVVTEKGSIRAPQVLFAGNAWSRLFCGNHGIEVPQLMLNMSMGHTSPAPDGPVGNGGQSEWAFRQQIDGAYSLGRVLGTKVPVTRDCIQLFSRFLPMIRMEWANVSTDFGPDTWADWRRKRRWGPGDISPMEKERVLSPVCSTAIADASLALNKIEFPAMEGAKVEEYWAGVLTATPDNMPIASAVAKLPGLYLATGCSYGLTWSPAIGKLMADLMTGQPTSLDPHPFRYERFFDGSELHLTH